METDKRLKLEFSKNNIEHLPVEIYLKMFSYLRGEDIKNIKLVCKHWNNISQTFEVGIKLRLKFALIVSNSVVEKLNFFQNSCQKFYDISLEHCNVDLLVPFFGVIGRNVKILSIDDCCFSSDSVLKEILQFTRNVEELKVVYCSFQQCTIPKYENIFKNIKILEILNKPVTKTKYGEVTNILHNIEENSINSFSVNYVYKIFRRGNVTNIAHLTEMVQRNNKSLKELKLSDCCFGEEITGNVLWESLSNHVCNLRKFSASHISSNTGSEKFMKFLILQESLTCLILNQIQSLNDNEMEVLIRNLPNLKEIELTNCVNLTDKSVLRLTKLKELNALTIIYNTEYVAVHKITIASLVIGIAKEQNLKIKALVLCNIKMDIEGLYAVIKNLPNLERLKCHSVNMIIQDEGFEVSKIISNNKYLVDLSFVNYKRTQEKILINHNNDVPSNVVLQVLELSYSESCREILSAIKLPNLKVLKIFYHDDTRQKDSGKEFIKALYESAPSIEHISLTVMSDTDTILDFILTHFKSLRSLSFVWHCENCLFFKRIHIKINQRLHTFLKKSPAGNFQFDESCDRCNSLFSKLKNSRVLQ